MVAGALEGIGSTRELLRQASVRLDLRRFLGYGLSERLPVHQTLSHAHTRRFVDAALFERLFLRSLELCKQHGLVEGTHIFRSTVSTPRRTRRWRACVRASPSRPRRRPRASDEGRAGRGRLRRGPPASLRSKRQPGGGRPGGERPALTLAEPRSGPTPKRRSSNATSVSVTDPEARLRGKPGQRPHLVYRGQVAVDRRQRVIVACRGEQADGFEGDAVEPLLDRARFACPELASIGADSGFAAERVWRATRASPDHRLHPAAADDAAEGRPGGDYRGAAPGAGGAGALQEPGRDRRAPAADGRRRRRDRRAEEPGHSRSCPAARDVRTSMSNSCSTARRSTVSGSPITPSRRRAASRPRRRAAQTQPPAWLPARGDTATDSRRRSQPLARRTPRHRPLRLGLRRSRSTEPRSGAQRAFLDRPLRSPGGRGAVHRR